MSWLVTQSCLNLCNLIDWIPPSSSVHGDSPGKNTGVVAMHSCRGSSHPRDRTQVSYIAGRLFTNQGTSEVHKITYRYTLHILLFLTVDHQFSTVQFSSVAHSCLPLCHPMNRNTPGLPIHHQLPEFTQTHVHQYVFIKGAAWRPDSLQDYKQFFPSASLQTPTRLLLGSRF